MNNKNHEPTPEERARIVQAVEDKFINPALKAAAPTELEQLRNKRDEARTKVRNLLSPIAQMAIEAPPNSPLHAHSEIGRAQLLITALKFYTDELRTLSKDEAIWLLAFAYAELTVAEYV